MKKVSLLLFVMSFLFFIVGCSNGASGEGSKVSMEEIVSKIKEQIAEDMAEIGVEDALVDGQLSTHIETNLLTASADDFPAAAYFEIMELDKEELASGIAIGAMMNINSDEIFIFEAKDEKLVPSLKEALEKELAAQEQTWSEYLPDQYEKVKNNILKTNGNFLLYVTYDHPERIEEVFDSFFK